MLFFSLKRFYSEFQHENKKCFYFHFKIDTFCFGMRERHNMDRYVEPNKEKRGIAFLEKQTE